MPWDMCMGPREPRGTFLGVDRSDLPCVPRFGQAFAPPVSPRGVPCDMACLFKVRGYLNDSVLYVCVCACLLMFRGKRNHQADSSCAVKEEDVRIGRGWRQRKTMMVPPLLNLLLVTCLPQSRLMCPRDHIRNEGLPLGNNVLRSRRRISYNDYPSAESAAGDERFWTFSGKTTGNLIAGYPPRGGDIQNPRSRNLLQPNKSTPTPKRYKKGGGTLIRVKQIR